jgi:hypothetical protein
MEALATNILTSNERKCQNAWRMKASHFLAMTLVVEAADGQPIKFSFFAIQKILKYAVGDITSAKKLRNSAVLIEVTSKA